MGRFDLSDAEWRIRIPPISENINRSVLGSSASSGRVGLPCEIRPVRLRDGGDDEGALIFWEESLIAVLSKLGPDHGAQAGRWHVECAFGPGLEANANFPNLEAACSFFENTLSRSS